MEFKVTVLPLFFINLPLIRLSFSVFLIQFLITLEFLISLQKKKLEFLVTHWNWIVGLLAKAEGLKLKIKDSEIQTK